MSEDEELTGLLLELFARDTQEQAWVMARLTLPQLRRMKWHWPAFAHDGQQAERDDWRVWLILAGRGFGKTRAGAEWVSELARNDGRLQFALVGASIDEVANVMIRGESGLMAVARCDEDVIWVPASRTVTFSSGAQAFAYSGCNPDKLRGPQHHHAWCDELAKWKHGPATWTNLRLGLRLAKHGKVLVTTTPKAGPLLRQIAADKHTLLSGGRTQDNPHLPGLYVEAMVEEYGGTRLGRQELDGVLIEDVEGALWTRELVERCRCSPPAIATDPSTACGGPPPRAKLGEDLVRIVIGVDPPVSSDGDACGIVAVGLGGDGVGYVLGDHTVSGFSPEGWARAVAAAAEAHGADRVVAEANQGGAMVESVLKAADCALPVRLVHARRGKAARAEPVAALFEAGRARFAGAFPALEDELCALAIGGDYAGPSRSPDRADAMVWAFTELMLRSKGKPAVRPL